MARMLAVQIGLNLSRIEGGAAPKAHMENNRNTIVRRGAKNQ
jgi:hypothetical protein